MLDPGTQSLVIAIASPAVLGVLGYVMKTYLSKTEKTTEKILEALNTEQVGIALIKNNTDRNTVLLDKALEDFSKLKDEHTKTRSSVDAVWDVLDVKRLSSKKES